MSLLIFKGYPWERRIRILSDSKATLYAIFNSLNCLLPLIRIAQLHSTAVAPSMPSYVSWLESELKPGVWIALTLCRLGVPWRTHPSTLGFKNGPWNLAPQAPIKGHLLQPENRGELVLCVVIIHPWQKWREEAWQINSTSSILCVNYPILSEDTTEHSTVSPSGSLWGGIWCILPTSFSLSLTQSWAWTI